MGCFPSSTDKDCNQSCPRMSSDPHGMVGPTSDKDRVGSFPVISVLLTLLAQGSVPFLHSEFAAVQNGRV